MAKINIADLEPVAAEIVIKNLSDIESQSIFGGEHLEASQILKFGLKALGFVVSIYAIEAITFFATSSYFKDSE